MTGVQDDQDAPAGQRAARLVAVGGTLGVLAYLVLCGLEIFVLAPRAGAPGRTLAQIYADLGASGELPHAMALPAVVLLGGLAVCLAVIAVTFVYRRMTWLASALTYLALLTMGAPMLVIAGFAPGMALSDVYGNSGADFHTVLSAGLVGLSGAALLSLLVLCGILAVDALRSSSPGVGRPQGGTTAR
ncbi:hypothetical protein [Brachybacterium hainanense]|uniref:Uncharacterized protein n=1 Tax=Brachybacterium hainanense TaxID=1541174 RepID=A0ABV6R658_9MICO